MSISKKIENKVMQVYDTWMHSYLNGDVKTYDSYLDDNYRFIDSTGNEEFLSKKDTANFFPNTSTQLGGNKEIRNSKKTIDQIDELVFITDLFDGWFLNESEWKFYGRFRFTSALRKNKSGWKFIYQHFSTPDSKAQEEETIGYDQISSENQQLREAVKRHTFELEQKNRELEVETAMERIRAQAMAMTKSSDLLDIVVTMRKEFIKLDHEAQYFWHMMWLPEKYEKAMTSGDGTRIGFVMELPRHIHGDIPLLDKWEKSNDSIVIYPMDAEAAIDYVDKMIKLGDFKNIDPQAPSHDDISRIGGLTFIMARTSHGEIGYSLPGVVKNPPKEDLDILEKFAGAFDLAHRRFLDLQIAEAQTRETQIELALEKVRSRTMGMQRSDELRDTSMLLFQQVEELGIKSFACGFNIWDDDKKAATAWMATKDRLQPPFKTNSAEDVYLLFHEAEKRGESLFILEQEGKKLVEHYKYLVTIPEIKELNEAGLSFPTFQIIHCAYFSKGYLMFITLEPVPDAHDIFKRFAKVFEQTFTRFQDLQKAEKQARESEIELALERVRARTMAMQHSDELQEASFLLDQQVRGLGIKTWGCAFNIYGKKESTEWFGNEAGVLPKYKVPRTGIFKEYYQKGQKGESLIIKEFSGEACVAHYEYMSSLPIIGDVLKKLKETNNGFPTYQIDHIVYFKYGYLLFITREPAPDAHDIFKRFAKVFEQTYTRFLDLQKAEAQTRESQIEAALERVRSRTLAMQSSGELAETAVVVFKQLIDLGIEPNRLYIGIVKEDNGLIEMWATDEAATEIGSKVNFDITKNKSISKIFYGWKKQQKSLTLTMEGKELQTYLKYIYEELGITVQKGLSQKKRFQTIAYFSKGFIGIAAPEEQPESTTDLLERFASVFNLTYTRFNDLQISEAQTREAKIEIALERVRSRTMGMQKSDELAETSAVLFQQIKEIATETWSCGFCIWQENDEVELWMGADSGGLLPPMLIPYKKEPTHKDIYEASLRKEPAYNKVWNGKELMEHYAFLRTIPSVAKAIKIMEDSGLTLPDQQCYYVGFFKHGYLLLITKEPNDDLIELSTRFTKVFDLTYTRFLDLQLKEKQSIELLAEKKRLEVTLTDLQATQKQLIQSEKMASLGELTAGIAHEIQNPLNFVNNFSEVSQELIDELKEELELGHMDGVKDILNDVIHNLQKINHHGKRADGIVKGMLQHSRKSSAVKEATDINTLCDEFLRLSYHGLRAKDKTFNATLVTDFDENSPKVNIFPQELGRVILNLLTNAFYAVNEKKQLNITGYKPTVSIGTKDNNGTVEIKVSDNGNGIPKHVLEKIYQPFFTTKPTGQGTGLGLSMSYDIITKGHGGSLKVVTEDGKGTEFIIELPLTQTVKMH